MIESDDICSVLAPITITDEMVDSVAVGEIQLPEDASPIWMPSTTYGIGDRVHLSHTHRVYESVAANNTNKDPSLPVNQYNAAGVATWWIEVGPTNRWAMFDSLISSQTVANGPLTIRLRPGAFNGMALFGIAADDIEITVRDEPDGNIIYSYSGALDGSMPADYYEYFFDTFRPQTQLIVTGIEPYGKSEVVITLGQASSAAKLGMLALGDVKPLGAPLRGASVEPVDYSYVSTDAFGNTTVKRRANATGLAIQARMDIADANTVLRTVQDLLGTPVVVIGSVKPGYEALTVFGLISGRQSYDEYNTPVLNLTVKGLI